MSQTIWFWYGFQLIRRQATYVPFDIYVRLGEHCSPIITLKNVLVREHINCLSLYLILAFDFSSRGPGVTYHSMSRMCSVFILTSTRTHWFVDFFNAKTRKLTIFEQIKLNPQNNWRLKLAVYHILQIKTIFVKDWHARHFLPDFFTSSRTRTLVVKRLTPALQRPH